MQCLCVCHQQYNNLFSYAACCVSTRKTKLLSICILASSHAVNFGVNTKTEQQHQHVENNETCGAKQMLLVVTFTEIYSGKCQLSSLQILDHNTHSTQSKEKAVQDHIIF